MQAVEIAAPGGPDALRPVERPTPRPGPGEVLIQVAAAGVNRPDVMQRQGRYPPPPGASDIPGLEVAGRVVALGEGVRAPALGEPVCALVTGGGYAQYCSAAAALCLPVPQGLEIAEAAALPETLFTVWSNLFERARLAPGEAVLVHGGTGGIGTAAIQLARARGATVIATAGSAPKCAVCLELGAARAVDYRREDFVAAAREATGGRGVDVVLDIVGGPYFQRNLEVLAPEGRLVIIAVQGGPRTEADLLPVMLKRLTVTGSTLRARDLAFKAGIAAALRREVWPLIARGEVRPVIHARFPLARAADAHRLMERSAHVGKLLLTVAHGS